MIKIKYPFRHRRSEGTVCAKCLELISFDNLLYRPEIVTKVCKKGFTLVYCNAYCMTKHNAEFHKDKQRAEQFKAMSKKWLIHLKSYGYGQN